MSLFSWLRTKVRDSILAGCQDALDALSALPPPAEPPVVLRLDGTPEAAEDVVEHANGRPRRQGVR